jgi:hypothetical protein
MRLSKLAGAAALGFTILSGPADASVVIDIFQSNGDLVATGGGTIDLTGLSLANTISPAKPRIGAILVGASGGGIDLYTGIIGPASLRPGVGPRFSSSGAGDLFGLMGMASSMFPRATFPTRRSPVPRLSPARRSPRSA